MSYVLAGDCFELGRHSYITEDYQKTIAWFKQALYRVDLEDFQTVDRQNILSYLEHSLYKAGRNSNGGLMSGRLISKVTLYNSGYIKGALHYTNEYLKGNPTDERLLTNKRAYERMIKGNTQEPRGDSGS